MRRSHKRGQKNESRAMKLSNGQLITTVPREISRWKHIDKATLLKWSDGGPGRVIIEIVPEG